MIVTKALRSLLIGAGVFAVLAATPPAFAQDRKAPAKADAPAGAAEQIAAVVNDDVLSVLDLEARLRLALLSSGLPNTQETQQRLAPQVLRALIDEKLELQEASHLGVSATDQEIETALSRIAEQNHLPRAELDHFLSQRGVPISALKFQIKANIAWTKLIQRKLRPTIQIGDEEIDNALERLHANAGKPEYLVAEIFLAVDQPSQEDEVKKFADHLVEEIRHGTAFPSVARQFSQAAGAGNGGDLGWVEPGQLSDELDRALSGMRAGQLSAPVRDPAGYHILLVRDQRAINGGDPKETQVHLKQMVFPITADADRKTQIARASEFARRVQGCAAFDQELKAVNQEKQGDVGTLRAGDMPPELARLVVDLPIGQVSPPFGDDRHVVVVVVCTRQAPAGSLPTREAIMVSMVNERLDMLQRRYLIDLKRAAFVDVRM
jgi:peptidyl-prolyl cis-trans isomerase SurA